MRDSKLDVLFQPLEMSNLSLKNRFFVAPMGTSFDMEQLTDFFVARAKGEVGLIHTGVASVHPSGRAGEKVELRLETDEDIKPFIPMVQKVHEAGAKIVAQVNHCGRYSFSRLIGQQAVAPSPIASKYTGETPRELTTDEADDLVMAFAQAAFRAREAGFDGVELVACSGYLMSEFLSPVTNKREDKYGGDTMGRATFVLSILKEARKLVGDDFNICVKFDGEDGMEGGNTLDDAVILAPAMVKAGADRLHLWAGWHEAPRPMLPMFVPRAAFTYLSAAIKTVVDVPVSTVGRINDPYVAADILNQGEADLIGLARAFLCDPELVKKTKEGRSREIRRCTGCCYCFDELMKVIRGGEEGDLKCSLNPELGHEGKGLVRAAEKKRNVVVVGGGPAGLETARLAAIRGHGVTLFEKDDKLGGLLNLAIVPPHKEELKNIIEYYDHQMDILSVDIKLGTAFTPDHLEQIRPDVVVLASGAEALVPDIPGIKNNRVMTALEVLEGTAVVGDRVVVIGGGLIGIETAEFLADQDKKVTVVEMLRSVAIDMTPSLRWGALARVRKKIDIRTLTKVVEVKKESVVVVDQENNEEELPAKSVVVATGLSSQTDLIPFMDQLGTEYHVVGSCRTPGQIAEAIEEAFSIGCKI